MASVRNILTAIAVIAVIVFAPYVAPLLGATGFLATAIGAVVVVLGTMAVYAISNALAPAGNASKGLSADAGRATIRVTEGPRWLCAGEARQGGSVVFTEFDGEGNLWCVIVHSDSVLVNTIKYMFDDIVVTLDGAGYVINNDFCLNEMNEPYKGTGTRVPYWQIWTTTYSSSNPTPPAITALTTALGSLWTSDHKLVGTTYSVLKGRAVSGENRYKVYKWRGPLGLGEPSVSIVGRWTRVFDPRDEDQIQDNFSTHLYTTNPVLIWAWFRTHPYGRRKPRSSINWTKVAEQATICDQDITGIEGTQNRYTCGVAIPDNKARATAEMEILASCDGQLAFDDQGRAYVNVGYYVTPTVALTRNRDIVAMESVEATNGESETQGVIVRYIDPLADYVAQPSAAWLNPNYYEIGVPATFLVVDILACQNHNQAMRLAKSIGMRSQPLHKIVPTTGLRGLKARQARIVNINYDNTFTGDYEIVTPVEVDASGMFCGFGAVPMDADRFTLLSGEELPRPVIENTSATADPTAPSGVSTYYLNNRLEFYFDPESRDDVVYDFEYAEFVDAGEPFWSGATTSMLQTFAYGGPVSDNKTYLTRWRGRNASGVVTDWSTPTTFDIADDGNFTVDEKIRVLIPTATRLENQWSTVSAAADLRGVSTATADTARDVWLAFLAAVSPAWNDTTADSVVSRVDYRAALSSYENALKALDIASAAKPFYRDVLGPGKSVQYRVRTRGFDGALQYGDVHIGLWNEETQTQIASLYNMYQVCHLAPGSTTWGVDGFDTLNNPTTFRAFNGITQPDRDQMAYRLNQICNAYRNCPIVVIGYDEPATGRLTAGIDAAMYRCGASRAVFGSGRFPFRAAYVLIGSANANEGNGAEYLAGVADISQAQIDIVFALTGDMLTINGVTPSDARDLVYAGGITIEALKPGEVGADVTYGNIAAGIIGQGALATQNLVDYATQITGAPPAGGQVTVGLGQNVKYYIPSGGSRAFDGSFGATGSTGSFGFRETTLTADGVVFATGASWYAGPLEPAQGTAAGTFVNGGASRLVTFQVSYAGAAVDPDFSQTFIRG